MLKATIAVLVLTACTSGSRMDASSAKAHSRTDAGRDAGTADAASDGSSPEPPGLAGIWGSAADDIWAVGEAGTILHYDGKRWTASDSPTTAPLHAVSGSAADDLWAVGDSVVLHWAGKRWADSLKDPDLHEELLSVWAGERHSAFMVGFTTDTNRGLVRRWDGAAWDWTELGRGAMWEVWGSGPTDLWIGGTSEMGQGFLDRGDGMTFDATAYNGESVRGIWGASSDDVWVVPYNGKFQHWDGSRWTTFALPSAAPIMAVSGSGPSDVWAVGLAGTILHWDGDSWTRDATATDANLLSVWAANEKDAWAVGADGIMLHWNGSDWRIL